jgi:four helix bundle protein
VRISILDLKFKIMDKGKENIIVKKTLEFSFAIIEYVELLEEKKKFIVAKQLLRSGTSVGANVYEAQAAESRPDFIHKFKLAAKEVEETKYWLFLCQHSKSYPECEPLMLLLRDIEKIIGRIIVSSKNGVSNKK